MYAPETNESLFHPAGLVIPVEEADIRKPTLNLAVGPSCPVRCDGCYNVFGDTAANGGLVSGEEVADFAADATAVGIGRAILSGGDPLSHPDIKQICTDLHDRLGLFTRLDTVGTSLLETPEDSGPRIIYKGKGSLTRYDVAEFAGHISRAHIPIDGATQQTAAVFRKGRPDSLAEAYQIAGRLGSAGIPMGVHTVASTANIHELPEMYAAIASKTTATQWRIFEFDPSGPNPTRHADELALAPGQFEAAAEKLKEHVIAARGLKVMSGKLGTAAERARGIYFMVNDAGMAYTRRPGQLEAEVLGHISHDRAIVMEGVKAYVDYYRQFTGGYTTA